MKFKERAALVKAAFSTGDSHEKTLRLIEEQRMPFVGGRTGKSGALVTGDSAMRLSAFYAGVRVTAQAIAGMGLGIYDRVEGGSREKVRDGSLHEILTVSPNRDQTPMEFWEGLVAWTVTQGNGYAYRDTSGTRLTSLLPIPSPLIYPRLSKEAGDVEYVMADRGKAEILPREKIFHVKGFGLGGLVGVSAVRYGVESISSALSTEESAAKFFANGMNASGFLSSDQILNEEQRAQLNEMMKAYSGSRNAGKLMVLEAGLKYSQIVLKPTDAQMLESRQFNIEEICRWLGLPPIIIGHSPKGQTMFGSGVEQIMLAWMQLGLNPLAKRIEQRIAKQLISPADRAVRYAEFNRESLMQMDSNAKQRFLSSMTAAGIMTRNEARSKLNLPSKDGADDLTAQTALAPLETLGETNDQS